MKPLISIIVPVYNGGKTLDRCIGSALSQSYSNFEIIFVDDGSTDNSCSVISKYDDSRIKTIKKENGGVSSARNLGIEHADGDYVLFLDCDDELAENALSNYASIVENTSFDLVSSSIRTITNGIKCDVIGFESDRYFEEDVFSALLVAPEKFGYAGGKMIRRDLIVDNSLKFDTKMRTQEDLSFLLDVYSLGSSFAFSSFEGYIYVLQHEERSISLFDNVKNRVKAINLAQNKAKTSKDALKHAADKLLYTVYSYLCYTKSKEDVCKLISPLCSLDGIKEAVNYRSEHSKYNDIAAALISSDLRSITRKFVFRAWIKKVLKK